MKLVMQVMLASMVALVPWFNTASAQSELEAGPSVVLSVSSLDEQFSDVKYLMGKAGFGDFAVMVDMATGEYVRGIDKTQPICISVFFREGEIEPVIVGFVPIVDLDDVLDTVADYADIEENGDEVTIIMDDGTEMHVRQTDGYAIVSNDTDMLANAPVTPESLLGDLPSQYNISGKMFVQRIPNDLRDIIMDGIRQGFDEGLSELEDEGIAIEDMDAQIKQIEETIEDADEMVMGLNINQEGNAINLDISMTGLPDSKLARQSEAGAAASDFAGFMSADASVAMNTCSGMLEEDVEYAVEQMNQFSEGVLDQMFAESNLSDEEAIFVEDVLTDFKSILIDTMKQEQKVDFAMAAIVDDEQFEVAGGGLIADSSEFDEMVRSIINEMNEKAGEEGIDVEVIFNNGSHAGVQFHTVTVQVPSSEEEARDLFGEELNVVFGVGEKAGYFGVGNDPVSVISAAIDRSKVSGASDDLPAMMFTMTATPLLEFLYRMQNDDALLQMIEVLEEGGNDRFQVVLDFIERGQFLRVELQDGFIQLAEVLFAEMGGMQQDF